MSGEDIGAMDLWEFCYCCSLQCHGSHFSSFQVDLILEQLGVFWANTEVVLDVITKKGQHAEQFIGFAHKPKLLQRFRDRMGEYRRFWDGVRDMCQKYLAGVREPGQRLYGFLDNDYPSDASGSGGHESAVVQSNVEGLERVGPRV